VADGRHEELLQRGGLYADLWRKQSGGFNPVQRAVTEVDPIDEFTELDEAAANSLNERASEHRR
jgi:hypothetical protein